MYGYGTYKMWNIHLNFHLITVSNKPLQLHMWHFRDGEYKKMHIAIRR